MLLSRAVVAHRLINFLSFYCQSLFFEHKLPLQKNAQCESFINYTHDIPLWLESYPLKDVVWDTNKKTIINFKAEERKRIIKEIIMYYKSRKD